MKIPSLLSAVCLLAWSIPAFAQYGVGSEVDVLRAPNGSITLDGVRDEPSWDIGAQFDLLANYDFYTSYSPDPDLEATASVLWGGAPAGASTSKVAQEGDWLYIFVQVLDNEIFIPDTSNAWMADQILIGIDPTHAGDSLFDADFGGAPWNAPDKGPYTYKIWPKGITLNYDYSIMPADSGWVMGTVYRDSTTLTWGVEMAAYIGPAGTAKSSAARQIGFNIGGAQASQGALDSGESEATYGYYSQWTCDPDTYSGQPCTYAGGSVMSDARSFGTLNLVGGGGGGEEYGVGVEMDVLRAPNGSITLDGVRDEPSWDIGAQLDLLGNYDFYTSYASEPDLEATASVLWGGAPEGASTSKAAQEGDWLYLYVEVLDNEIFIPDTSEAWMADQILIGIDPTHAGDSLFDADFGGAPWNAPDKGPYAYKVWPKGITLNFDYSIMPADSGWVVGTVFRDSTTLTWGVEMAAYIGPPGTAKSSAARQIGFNIGGAQASQAALDAGESEATYGYYSQWICDPETRPGEFCNYAGGTVMSHAGSFATLNLVGGGGGGEGYGVGTTVQAPKAQPGDIVLDGTGDEARWSDAPKFDLLGHYDFYTSYASEPDLEATASVLWGGAPEGAGTSKAAQDGDWLYVYVEVLDNEIFIPDTSEAWMADQILIGIDPTHAGDSLFDADFGGAPWNAPDKGPYAYKIWPLGITLNFDYSIMPADSGWVVGTVFRDSTTLTWGVEMAAYIGENPSGKSGAAREIGFNIGGAQASQAALDAGESEATYGYYSQWICDPETRPGEFCNYAGGTVMSHAGSFATIELVETVNPAVEEDPVAGVPEQFVLSQNYPNPFNPTTTIEYGLKTPSRATLDVFNVYGQRVARLIDEQKPAGNYRLSWDAETLPSGMYVYQLRVDGSLVASKTMTLIK